MTVINPNSVAGITSIPVQSGNSLSVHKSNGELIRTLTSNSGVSTFSSISVGTATTDNSAAKSINIGLGASISQHADNSLSFGTGGDERARIDSSGRLLIGSSSNNTDDVGDSALQVHTLDDLHPAIRVNSASNNGYTMFGDAYAADESQVNIGISHSSSSLVLSQGCKVNISTDDAYVSSQDSYSTRPNVLRLDSDGSLSFLNTSSASTTPTDNAVSLTERFRIDSSGRLLYGATSSTRETSLILQGNSNSYTTNPGVLELRVGQVPSSQASLGSLVFGCTGDKIGGTINAIADNADWSSGSSHPTALRFYTTAASSTTQVERLRIAANGDVRVTSRGSSASGAPFYVAVTGKSSVDYSGGNDDTACLRIVDNGSTNSYYHGIELRAKRDGDARIYVQDKGSDAVDLVFATDNSGIVEGMRLDSSQRLLIGTTSAVGGLAHHLQVVEPDGGKLCLARNDTTVSNGANLGEIAAYGNDNNGNYQESSKIEFQAGLNHGDNDKPGRLVFSVTADGGSSATERLRITHDGKLDMFAGGATSFRIDPASTAGKAIFTVDGDSNFGTSGYDFRIDGTDSNALMMVIRRGTNPFVGIGRDSQQSAERLSVDRGGQVAFFTMSTNANHSNIQMLSAYATSSTNGTQISFMDNTGTQRGKIINDNSTTQYVTSSDYRLKENEVLISDGITRLKTLKPYRFNWKQKPGVTVDGFFAHEVTSAVPEAIDGEKDAVVTQAMVDAGTHDVSKLGDPEYQMIDQAKLVPLLTAALQEAVTKIETLETKVAALEGG